jgi:hypothetical protein
VLLKKDKGRGIRSRVGRARVEEGNAEGGGASWLRCMREERLLLFFARKELMLDARERVRVEKRRRSEERRRLRRIDLVRDPSVFRGGVFGDKIRRGERSGSLGRLRLDDVDGQGRRDGLAVDLDVVEPARSTFVSPAHADVAKRRGVERSRGGGGGGGGGREGGRRSE